MSNVVRFPNAKHGDPVALLEALLDEVHAGDTSAVFVISMAPGAWNLDLEGDCCVETLIGYIEYAKQQLLRRMN